MSKWLQYLSLILGSLFILLPPYIIIVTAFKTEGDFSRSPAYSLPDSFTLDNFQKVLEKGQFLMAFSNIGYIIVASLIGNVLLGTMVSYALGRFQFRLKGAVLGAYALSMIIPGITTQVATFNVVKSLHLMNSHYAMIVLNLGVDVVQILIYMQFIRSIPYDIDESAFMEGASLFKIYYAVILPLLKPAIATIVILKSIAIYNDMFTPFLYMPSQKLSVVTTELMRFSGRYGNSYTMLCAAILIVAIPTVVMYLFLQKYIFKGVVNGAVK